MSIIGDRYGGASRRFTFAVALEHWATLHSAFYRWGTRHMDHGGQRGCGNRKVTGALPQCVMYLANLLG